MKSIKLGTLTNEKIYTIYAMLRGGELSSVSLGWCAFIGIFIGLQPYYGAHLLLAVTLGIALRLNAMVIYAFAWVSIPPMVPIILFSNLSVGHWFLTGEFLSWSQTIGQGGSLPEIGLGLVVGSLINGVVFGAIVGVLMWRLSRNYFARSQVNRSTDSFADTIFAVAKHYDECHPKHRFYVPTKMAMDELTQMLIRYSRRSKGKSDFGRVLDVGCGRGQYSLLLRELGSVELLHGVDLDERKIDVARRALAHVNQDLPEPLAWTFSVGDATNMISGTFNTILLLDVLHYVPQTEQLAMLNDLAERLDEGGVLIIRDTRAGKGGRLVKAMEWFTKLFRINRGRALDFIAWDQVLAFMEHLGFRIIEDNSSALLGNSFYVMEKAQSIGRSEAGVEAAMAKVEVV